MAGNGIVRNNRLQRELRQLKKDPDEAFKVELVDGDITRWKVSIVGSPETVFEGRILTLWLEFPEGYPFYKPRAHFTRDSVYHPNVRLSDGVPCINILKEDWTPSITVRVLVYSLLSLLVAADLENPANELAGSRWGRPDEYKIIAQHHLDTYGEKKP